MDGIGLVEDPLLAASSDSAAPWTATAEETAGGQPGFEGGPVADPALKKSPRIKGHCPPEMILSKQHRTGKYLGGSVVEHNQPQYASASGMRRGITTAHPRTKVSVKHIL